MNPSKTPGKGHLRRIARRAMLERGLLPDFSQSALAETSAITANVTHAEGAIRDLRSLLWASIDNDDSRDLDQLSVARPMGGGDVTIFVAIADVNAVKVERQVRKSAAALLLESRVGDQFDALVTGALAKGTCVRIFQPAVEGKVVRGYQGLDVGDRVRVELVGTDVDRGFIDFARAKSS